MKRFLIYASILCFAMSVSSCDKSNGGTTDGHGKAVMNTVSIVVSDSTWTYFSFKTGQTVGMSTLGDENADGLWASRKDWDFALCSDMLKTNGGTSGTGNGGVQAATRFNFNALEQAPVSGYVEDTDGMIVKR